MFEPLTFSVADLTAYIGALFDSDGALQDVWVQGEISNMTVASSGHWYFTLKDGQAQLRCALWRSSAARQGFRPENGDAVLAHGRVSVYAPRGEYQLYADSVQRAGLGDLYARLEQLKEKLRAEGLFDRPRQRIPAFPLRVGIVTSAEAAAFQDVQNVLRRRFPLAQAILSATPVQGSGAPAQIVAALARLNAHDACDVILLVRGGGSIEDLWAFNDEGVARAVAASRIPVISGVGHETDFTLVDFVSDLRAPTPSAAAEQAAPDLADLRAGLSAMAFALDSAALTRLETLRALTTSAARTLGHMTPARRVTLLRQRVDDRAARLERQQRQQIALLRERLAARRAALEAASPQAILARGYAIVTHTSGARVSGVADAKPGDSLSIRLHDGTLSARVISEEELHEPHQRSLF
jgi:exodeoxyribonuclease VII large subunit